MFVDRIITKLSLSLDSINVHVMQRIIHTMRHQIRKENSSIELNWSLGLYVIRYQLRISLFIAEESNCGTRSLDRQSQSRYQARIIDRT